MEGLGAGGKRQRLDDGGAAAAGAGGANVDAGDEGPLDSGATLEEREATAFAYQIKQHACLRNTPAAKEKFIATSVLHCMLCDSDVKAAHGSRGTVRRHMTGANHLKMVELDGTRRRAAMMEGMFKRVGAITPEAAAAQKAEERALRGLTSALALGLGLNPSQQQRVLGKGSAVLSGVALLQARGLSIGCSETIASDAVVTEQALLDYVRRYHARCAP